MTGDWTIGVCGWTLDRHDPVRSLMLAGELGFRVIQLGFFGRSAVENVDAKSVQRAAEEAGVSIAATFVAFDGEDYSSIERIHSTGGLMPDGEVESRLDVICKAAELTKDIGARVMAMHAGTVTDDPRLLGERLGRAADLLAERGLRLLLETGRESAESLRRFLDVVAKPNVGVSFDPANFVVYGTDDPVVAATRLRGCIELVHLKDASRSPRPGTEFGPPAPFGAGDVPIARIVSKLRAVGYAGPLLVESAGPAAGPQDLRNAAAYLRSLFP